MRRKKRHTSETNRERFEDRAADQGTGFLAEFWDFFLTNKKWWMIPIVVVLLLLAGLVLLGGTALAPFIYTLF
jgi:Family of unknown function (DUF5989)